MEIWWNPWRRIWRIKDWRFERCIWDMQSWFRSSIFWGGLSTCRHERFLRAERKRICWIIIRWSQNCIWFCAHFAKINWNDVLEKIRSSKVICKDSVLRTSRDKMIKLNVKMWLLKIILTKEIFIISAIDWLQIWNHRWKMVLEEWWMKVNFVASWVRSQIIFWCERGQWVRWYATVF